MNVIPIELAHSDFKQASNEIILSNTGVIPYQASNKVRSMSIGDSHIE
jgi:hypothetical protein